MRSAVHLLGQPRIQRSSGADYQVRSRKSWALLAYLLLSGRPPTRAQLAGLLFTEADDPLRALRWNLSEVRRVLGEEASVEGDPVVLTLPPDMTVDVHVVTRGSWMEAVRLPGFGDELLESFTIRAGAAFESWLLAEQRHIAAATEAILHEAAVGSSSHGRLDEAIAYAVRVVAINPLDENHQALLIRLYRLAGDSAAAQRQYDVCSELFDRELGVPPGSAVEAAITQHRRQPEASADATSIRAIIEAGSAAIAAGAAQAGVDSLRTAVRMADSAPDHGLRLHARMVLAEALIHSLGGLDEEGLASLHEADEIARADGDRAVVAGARAELGYVDFLRGRYERAEHWLTQALEWADGSPWIGAKAATYLGAVESDRANYPHALALLDEAVTLACATEDPHREAYATSMLGRVRLLRGDLEAATRHLDRSMAVAHADHWLAFLPWPQSLRGEVQLAAGDVAGAAATFEQAFARACNLGDPCWEGLSARGVAMVAEASGDVAGAFAGLLDARARCSRLADPYVWLDAHILDAMCELGLRHDHPATATWIDQMRELASRTGMRELTVRSLLHGAALGEPGAAEASVILAASIDNPALHIRVHATAPPRAPKIPAGASSRHASTLSDDGAVR